MSDSGFNGFYFNLAKEVVDFLRNSECCLKEVPQKIKGNENLSRSAVEQCDYGDSDLW
jgi:hypothetical protein